MAVTYRPRKQAVPYKTRLTGRLMPLRMRGSAQTRRAPRHFMVGFIGFLEFGDNARDNNPFRPERLPFDPKRALNRLAVWVSWEHIEVQVSGSTSQNGGLELPGVRSNYLRR
jgi:hypothetical protein